MAAVQPTVQLPQAYNLLGPDQKLTPQWYFFFQQLLKALPPIGTSGVTTTTAPMNMAWGLDIDKGVPTAGNVYLAYDTGKIYIGDGSTYHVEFPAITGDATKPVGSEVLTLNNVNYSPGTYGDGFNIPVISVNAKGLVTNITLEPVTSGAVPAAGSTGMVQFNNAGSLAASGSFTYSISGDQLSVTNLLVHGNLQLLSFTPNAFTYSNATNQLKSTASATDGQLLIGSTGSVPVAATLTAGSGIGITNGAGSITISSNNPVEFTFHYGDATPKPLLTIPAGKVITAVNMFITTAFDGVGASLSVGDASNANSVMATTDNNPGMETNWANNPGVFFGSDTPINLYITAGAGATQGAGLLTISYQE